MFCVSVILWRMLLLGGDALSQEVMEWVRTS